MHFVKCLLILILAPRAFSDVYNPNIIPVGESSAFMGNTGVGGLKDTGAVFYNPALLADLKSSEVSLTGSAYFMFEIAFDGAFAIDNENIPYRANGFMTIPHSLVSTVKLANQTFAFSVLVPESIRTGTTKEFQTTNFSGVVMPSGQSQSIWVGLSRGHRLTKDWAWGLTFWGIYHSELETTGAEFRYQDGSQIFGKDISRTDIQHMSLASTLGVHYQLTDSVSIGFRAQSPNFRVHSEAEYQRNNSFVNTTNPPGSQIVYTNERIYTQKAEYELPADFTLGVMVTPSARFNYMIDLSYQLTTDFTMIPQLAPERKFQTKPTARINAGLEWKIRDKLPLRFGAFFNPSAMSDINTVSDNSLRTDVWGASLGLAMSSNANSESGIGVFYGQGTGVARNSSGDELPGRLRFGGLMLSTSYFF